MMEVAGGIALVAGTVFLFLGGLGLYRMPDTYNRIQAGTKATTLGTVLSLVGAGLLQPEWASKLFLIGIFLLFTNPLSSQVLARAAHRVGVRPAKSMKADVLDDDLTKSGKEDERS